MTQLRERSNWQIWKHEVEAALRTCGAFPPSVQIDGKLQPLERGLNHRNFRFWVASDAPSPCAIDMPYVLRTPGATPVGRSHDEAIAGLHREATTLQALALREFGFTVPRFVCFVHDPQGRASGFIETGLLGTSLDYFKKQPDKRPYVIDAIGRIASELHRTPLDAFGFLPRHADSRGHVLASLDGFGHEFTAQDPDARAVAGWVRDHLPEDRPAVLLHGDLLPQNILWNSETDDVGVVDWEFTVIGDPAYDLAIVTRGCARLFGASNGLQQLLHAYRRAGGTPIEAADVVNHELLMVLKWLEESVRVERDERHEGHAPSHWRNQIQTILRRAESA